MLCQTSANRAGLKLTCRNFIALLAVGLSTREEEIRYRQACRTFKQCPSSPKVFICWYTLIPSSCILHCENSFLFFFHHMLDWICSSLILITWGQCSWILILIYLGLCTNGSPFRFYLIIFLLGFLFDWSVIVLLSTWRNSNCS